MQDLLWAIARKLIDYANKVLKAGNIGHAVMSP